MAPLDLQRSRTPARYEMGLVRVTDLFAEPGGLQGAKAGEKEGATTRDWREGTTDEECRPPWDEHGTVHGTDSITAVEVPFG